MSSIFRLKGTLNLEEAAKDKQELRAAPEKWGTLKRVRVRWFRVSPRYYPKSLSFDEWNFKKQER